MLWIKYIRFLFFLVLSLQSISAQQLTDTLSVGAAVNFVIENNPELERLRIELKALYAAKRQAGLGPNPELEIEIEDIFGTGELAGFGGSEISAGISNEFLLAGKISKREKVASLDIGLAEWDYEIKQWELITHVRRLFCNALAIQALLEKNEELIRISEDFIVNLEKRVNAGKISPVEVSRAKIVHQSLQIEQAGFEADYGKALSELRALLFKPGMHIRYLKGELMDETEIRLPKNLEERLSNNPVLKKYETLFQRQKAVVDYEESMSIPNITLRAGYKRLNEISANTFFVGASIPLPLFNRNQGNIEEALIRQSLYQTEYTGIKNHLLGRLEGLYTTIRALSKICRQLKEESIPEAEKTFTLIKEGNLVGKYSIIDVLDAERTLFELEMKYLKTLGELNETIIEIEGLTAKSL